MSTSSPTATLEGPSTALDRAAIETGLVERARDGDREAFEALVGLRLPPTFRTAMAILGDEADARDATQAIFVHAWRHLPQLRDPAMFPGWFGRIVVNTARTTLRGRRRRTMREVSVTVLPEEGGAIASIGVAHDDRTAQLDRLERALDRLAANDRVLLWLRHYEGLSNAEVGARIGIPEGTAKSRLFAARQALKRALEDEDR